jgi:hypothetical protein
VKVHLVYRHNFILVFSCFFSINLVLRLEYQAVRLLFIKPVNTDGTIINTLISFQVNLIKLGGSLGNVPQKMKNLL